VRQYQIIGREYRGSLKIKNRTKNQHFVPRFYLRNFTDDSGKLWTHDSIQDSLRHSTPENTAFEANIYTPEIQNGERLDEIEERLSKIESVAAELMTDLVSFRRLEPPQKEAFAAFLATMYARSPAQLRQYAAFQAQTLDWMARTGLERELTKEKVAAEQLEEDDTMLALLERNDLYEIDVDRRVGLKAFDISETLSRLMTRMTWTFEISEGQEIITSDNCVFWVDGGGSVPLNQTYGFGLANRRAVIPFPLTPKVVLRLDWDLGQAWAKHKLVKKQARLSNQFQAKHKERFLYFRTNDEGFQRLGKKYREPVQQLDAGVDGPNVNVVRKLR
jgi:hypothetical protein